MKYSSKFMVMLHLYLSILMYSQFVLAQIHPGPDPNQIPVKNHTILIVLTHTDDYISIAPLLARYSAERHNVYYAIFNGVQDSVMLLPGGKKHEELLCAAKILGVNEPLIFIGPAGVGNNTQKEIAQNTIQLIYKIKPDVIITWGPDGLTGHPRHILVSNTVTRVFQQQSLLEHQPKKLYYIAYPQSRIANKQISFGEIANEDGPFGTVPDEYITTTIEGKNYLQQTREAIACHTLPKGKLNKDWQETWYIRLSIVLDGKVFLRLVFPSSKEKETDIFQGM